MIWRYRWRLLLGIVFIMLTNVFAVWAPSMIGEGVNALNAANRNFLVPLSEGVAMETLANQEVSVPQNLRTLAGWFGTEDLATTRPESRQDVLDIVVWIGLMQAGLFLLAYLVKGVFSFLTRQTIIVMSRLVEFDLKGKIYGPYQRLDATFYKEQDTGDLMNRISEDVSNVRMYLGPAIMYSLNLTVLVSMVVGVMLYIDPILTLFALLPLPLMSAGIYFISANIHRKSDAKQQAQSAVSTFVQQHIAGMRVLKSFHRERASAARFDVETDVYKMRVLDLVKVEAMFMPLIVLLVGLSTILTVYVGGHRVANGDLDLGHIFQFVFYVNLLTWPFASVGWVTSLVQKAEASMARILDFLDARPTVQSLEQGARNAPLSDSPALVFDRVSWTYPETGIEALKEVSFEVQSGETVGITGRTGSGKSTVLQLAMRMMDPANGSVVLDGTPLPSWELEALRNHLGYVPQDVFLFSDTIGNNIAFGVRDNETSKQRIQQAAEDAGVADDILAFERGFDTLLGERGVNLSGGQKQRVSIARALIKRPDILLLDDCLSAVDTETEERILSAIHRQSSSCNLIVSHRLASLRGADRILVLDEGQLVEQGTSEELLRAGGLYATMHEQQQGEGWTP
ncbi:MAG: ABC transporter ATP-binding protein [Bacteroidota bacterium]|nr:ABC transporter ATP-binding protein [Bacteroidota bacterium]